MEMIHNADIRPACVVVGGAGGIGSALLPLLARMPGIKRITMIDRDKYEMKNVNHQDIVPGDVGVSKVRVQARRLARINPSIEVRSLYADIHDVPLGLLQADILLGCFDSREARRILSQAAWRFGSPYIDAGIRIDNGLFVRISVFVPGPDAPCLECAWDERDYDLLEQTHPCQPDPVPTAPTNAPASLGSLAASIQALECHKLLMKYDSDGVRSQQILLDIQRHSYYVSRLCRNKRCRFDHGIWHIRNIREGPREISVGQMFDLEDAPSDPGHENGWIRVEGRPFVTRLQCRQCGAIHKVLGLLGRLANSKRLCGKCRSPMTPAGFDLVNKLDPSRIGKSVFTWPLNRLGFRSGDVISVGPDTRGGEIHCAIGCDPL